MEMDGWVDDLPYMEHCLQYTWLNREIERVGAKLRAISLFRFFFLRTRTGDARKFIPRERGGRGGGSVLISMSCVVAAAVVVVRFG